MAVAPLAKVSELLDLWMVVLLIILDRKTMGIINSNVAPQSKENPCGLIAQ